MREQIGWYDPGSKRFVYSDVRAAQPQLHFAYTVPVFADDETEAEWTQVAGLLWTQVANRLLVNQQKIMYVLGEQCSQSMAGDLAEACRRTGDVIARLR